MNASVPHIASDERTVAALTHLSGLSSYVFPLGGAIVPLIIWMVRKDSPVISSIAKQALILNLVVWLLAGLSWIFWITIILIPVVMLFWWVLGIVAVALPIIGALKANQGTYLRYPMVGVAPSA